MISYALLQIRSYPLHNGGKISGSVRLRGISLRALARGVGTGKGGGGPWPWLEMSVPVGIIPMR